MNALELQRLRVEHLANELRPRLEDLCAELGREVAFLDWQLKWYNFWAICIKDKWARKLYSYLCLRK